MGRRKKLVLVDMAAALPWWVGVIAAVIVHIFLKIVAQIEIIPEPGTQNFGAVAVGSMIRSLANVGQYLFPFLLLLGSLLSFLDRWRRTTLFEQASSQVGSIMSMHWRELEMLVGEAFRLQGYRITETPPGPDGGVDIRMTKDGKRYLVQCKHYKASKVSVGIVRELYGVMTAEGAGGGFVVTSGRFTRDAREFAKKHHVELIDGPGLAAMIRKAKDFGGLPAKPGVETNQSGKSPECPGCGLAMVKRTARRGSSAGQEFWGCSDYPRCKTTLPLITAIKPKSIDTSAQITSSNKPLNWWQQ